MTIIAPSANPIPRPLAIAWRAITAAFRASGIFGPALITEPTQRPAGALPMPALPLEVVIHRRALRTCNRNPDAAAQYVKTHTVLSKGRCSSRAT